MTPEVTAYLARIGLAGRDLTPTHETLVAVHRAHLDTVPYENLATMLGQPPSVQPAECLARIGAVGRAGYCFHQNAALELALGELGFRVGRRPGHSWHAPHERWTGGLDHLVLVVDGLPTAANPGGRWWPDVGLGDGFRDPLPLVVGDHPQGPFRYRIAEVRPDGWSFEHDPDASIAGVEVSAGRIGQAEVERAHARLTTAPDGPFTRLVVVQRRSADSADTLRGCVWTHAGGDGAQSTDLTTYDAWRGVIADVLGLRLDDVADDELRRLHADQRARHEEWTAAGRP